MADTAMFSSFRRPGPPRTEQPIEQLAAAATLIEPPKPAPASAPEVDAPEYKPEAVSAPVPDDSFQAVDATAAAITSADEPLPAAWGLGSVALGADQLGLAHPDVIMLQAKLRGAAPVFLEAQTAGIYRPPGFRPAPWSGFAYDQPAEIKSGLAAGTRILTARGEVEVEKLVPGDTAMALRGPALLPISWIGRTPATAAPVMIEPGALGRDIPRRALCLGRDQAVFLGPESVAAHTLVNGTTVRFAELEATDLFHIDVGRADIILAEGLALGSSHGASRRR